MWRCDQLRSERNAACEEVERLTVALAESETRLLALQAKEEADNAPDPMEYEAMQRKLDELVRRHGEGQRELGESRATIAALQGQVATHSLSTCIRVRCR